MTDPYVYPGTHVLKNTFDIRDAGDLDTVERRLTRARAREPLEPPNTPKGYRALHRHLFQDLYDWAGQYRTCELGRSLWFEEAKNVEQRMNKQFRALNAEQNLSGLDQDSFCRRLAVHLCELNDIHPFREGNGRTNRLFAKELARQARHELSIERIERTQWLDASIAGFHHDDYRPMEELLKRAIIRVDRED